MAIEYRIYQNDLAGGPLDLSAPEDTTSGLTWDSDTLPGGAAGEWLVRAYDTVTGLECGNGDARISVRLSADGDDLSSLPNAPVGLTARATAGGSVLVEWTYNPGGQGSSPTGFHVYAGTPAIDYTTSLAIVPADLSRLGRTYRATLTGLTDGAAYEVGVRAFSTAGEEGNTSVVNVTATSTGPAAVASLAAVSVS